jgi:hypothetical protein
MRRFVRVVVTYHHITQESNRPSSDQTPVEWWDAPTCFSTSIVSAFSGSQEPHSHELGCFSRSEDVEHSQSS